MTVTPTTAGHGSAGSAWQWTHRRRRPGTRYGVSGPWVVGNVATEDPGGPTAGVNYVLWALVGMASYTMVAPLMKIALTDVPSDVAVLLSNLILVVVAGGLVVVSGTNVSGFLTHSKSPYVYAAGLFLAVGIIAYYRALSLGPVSVVVPVFAMFIVTSSAVGVVLLDETLTLRRGVGIALAIVAVYLTATG